MSYCKKCGAYVPMDDTVCPACGYDPEAEAKELERKRQEEQKREQEERQRRAEEEQERQQAEARRKAEEAQHRHRTSYRTGGAASASQTTSRRTGASDQGEWKAPWTESAAPAYNDRNDYERAKARDSASNQGLSVLSYFGPLFLIPLLLRGDDKFARFHANQGLVLLIFEAIVKMAAGWIPVAGGLVEAAGGIFALYCIIRGIRSVLKGRKDKLPLIGDFRIL